MCSDWVAGGNFLIGWIKAHTDSFPVALIPIAVLATAGTFCAITVGRGQTRTATLRAQHAIAWHEGWNARSALPNQAAQRVGDLT